jgi:hypothetical protein
MKNLNTICFAICLTLLTNMNAQPIQYEQIDVNNVKASVNASSFLFNTEIDLCGQSAVTQSDASFEVPKGGDVHAIYNSTIWLAGVDHENKLHVAAQTHKDCDEQEFYLGPYSNSYNIDRKNYRRVWKISKAEVDYHQANFNDITYIMPLDIMNWPAHGDILNGESKDLAPFVDVNNNSVYDPENGDYPEIKGDVAIYNIFNDNGAHASSGEIMHVEIHRMVYAFNDESAVNNTVFVNYQIFNRSNKPYKDFYFGTFTDFDLGNPSDDFLACDPTRNLFYAYNGDLNDEASSTSSGYGVTPPAIGAVMLNQPLDGFVDVNYLSFGVPWGVPENAMDYYNLMQGKWKDGSHMYYGNSGYESPENRDSLRITRHKFPRNDNPAFPNEFWGENTSGNQPGDRRGAGIVGPLNLGVAGSFCVDIGYVYARASVGGDTLATIEALKEAVDVVQAFYDNKNFPCSNNEGNTYDFVSNYQTFCSGDTVQFTNVSVADSVQVKWLLPGATTPEVDAYHAQDIIYPSVGTYDVTMRVYVGADSLDITKTDYITISNPKSILVEGIAFDFIGACEDSSYYFELSLINAVGMDANTTDISYYKKNDNNTAWVLTDAYETELNQQNDSVLAILTPYAGCYNQNEYLVKATPAYPTDVEFATDELIRTQEGFKSLAYETINVHYQWFEMVHPQVSFGINELPDEEGKREIKDLTEDKYYFAKLTMLEAPYCVFYSDTLLYTTTDIKEVSLNSLIHVMPNPSKGVFNIMSVNDISGVLTMRSFDGKTVHEENIKGNQTSIDVSHLASGVYVIELINNKGDRMMEKVIKE